MFVLRSCEAPSLALYRRPPSRVLDCRPLMVCQGNRCRSLWVAVGVGWNLCAGSVVELSNVNAVLGFVLARTTHIHIAWGSHGDGDRKKVFGGGRGLATGVADAHLPGLFES